MRIGAGAALAIVGSDQADARGRRGSGSQSDRRHEGPAPAGFRVGVAQAARVRKVECRILAHDVA